MTLTATRKQRKPARKPQRRVHMYPGSPALVEMTVGKESYSYWLRPLAADFGDAYEFRKLLAEMASKEK